MASPAARPPRLQSKGALRPDALYVERAADATLREALLAGEFCYVLAPRQIGKSSLRFHVARQLEGQDSGAVRCAHLDLNAMGLAEGEGGRERWYFALIQKLADDLGLPDPGDYFHTVRGQLPPVQRWRRYLREVTLADPEARVVVFVDEIDYVRKLAFDSDEFFAAVRALYNDRAEDAALGRLTFCLLGVAAPSDLIKDGKITPFNIGQNIHLTDFSRPEIAAFSATLAPLGGQAADWLDELFAWTSGHPYMTHALCEQLLQSARTSPLASPTRPNIKERVEAVVRKGFLLLGRAEDPSLSYAETRLDGHPRRADLLALYRRLLLGQEEPVRGDDPVQQELRLCGLCAVAESGDRPTLRVRNRIFSRVFDYAWVHDQEVAHLWSEAFQKWRSGGKRRDALLRGTQLELAQEWAHDHRNEVSVEENEFLLASVEEARRQTEAQAEADRARLLRRVIVGLASALGLFVVLTAAAYGLYRKASRQEQAARDAETRERETARRERLAKEEAESRTRTEQSLRAAALVQQGGSPYVALVAGMNAAAPELLGKSGSGQPVSWPSLEGLMLAAYQATPSVALVGHSNSIDVVAYAPGGRQLLTASEDRTGWLWSVATRKPEALLEGHRGGIFAAVYSPDASRVLTTSYDGTARIWDAATGRQLRLLETNPTGLFAAAFSPDGRLIATGAEDGRAHIFDAATGRLLHTLVGHRLRVCTAAFSPDSKQLMTGSYDATARIWSSATGQQAGPTLIHANRVFSVAYTPDGRRAATGSYDNLARLWDLATGKSVQLFEGHRSHVLSVAFSPSGQQLLTGSFDGTARIWDTATGRTLRVLEGHRDGVNTASYAPSGEQVVTGSYDYSARIWDLTGGKTQQVFAGHKKWLLTASHAPGGKQLFIGSYDGAARIWDTATGRVLHSLEGHRGSILTAAYSRDGGQLVTGSYDGTIRLWDTKSGRELRQLEPHPELVHAVLFSPDGRTVASGHEEGMVRLHDVPSGRMLLQLQDEGGTVLAVAFSPDGRRLATGSGEGGVRLWDPERGTEVATLARHGALIRVLAFSPDGKQLAAGCADGAGRVWDIESRQLVRLLEGHRGRLDAIAFSPDGAQLATGGDDGTARLWQVAGPRTGKSILMLATQASALLSTEFFVEPGGPVLRTISADSANRAWSEGFPLAAPELYRYGCRVLRGFAPDRVPNVPESSVRQALASCPK